MRIDEIRVGDTISFYYKGGTYRHQRILTVEEIPLRYDNKASFFGSDLSLSGRPRRFLWRLMQDVKFVESTKVAKSKMFCCNALDKTITMENDNIKIIFVVKNDKTFKRMQAVVQMMESLDAT